MNGSALTALAIDLTAGEPPGAIHPTIWMGHWIRRGRVKRRSHKPLPSLAEGAAIVGGGALVVGAAALAVDKVLDLLPRAPRIIGRGFALKPAIAVRGLLGAAREVEMALTADDLDEARRLLAWHLVSRDTSNLNASEVAAAAIESVAENFNDALIAPLCAFRLGGLTGAYLFRFVNTADSMLGYHTLELEWFGKAAARLDDALGILPSRLSGLLLVLAAAATGNSGSGAMSVMLCDAGATESPNAGWPMAAMAGALGVRLEKRGHYQLNAAAKGPSALDIARARRIVLVGSVLATLLADLL